METIEGSIGMIEKRASLRHVAGLRFVARAGRGEDLKLEAASGEPGYRPTEVLLIALAACAAMDVVSILAKKRQSWTGYAVEVRGLEREEHPQVFTWIELVHAFNGPDLEDGAVRRAIELSASRYCPVNAMLAAGPTEIHHRYLIGQEGGTAGSAMDEAAGALEVVITGPDGRIDVTSWGTG